MPKSHGVNKKAALIVSPSHLPLTWFLPGSFVVFQELLCQPSFALIRVLKKMYFQSKTNFSFNLLLVGFDFAALCLCVL